MTRNNAPVIRYAAITIPDTFRIVWDVAKIIWNVFRIIRNTAKIIRDVYRMIKNGAPAITNAAPSMRDNVKRAAQHRQHEYKCKKNTARGNDNFYTITMPENL